MKETITMKNTSVILSEAQWGTADLGGQRRDSAAGVGGAPLSTPHVTRWQFVTFATDNGEGHITHFVYFETADA